jgi:maltose alpha-D-glucosyltransferase/alpha-amylase
MTGIDRSATDWYRDAVIYELHVRAFADSNGDGIGDFPGLTSRLDYLRDLGVTALWLLPFYPSPLHDDGYDIADYQAVNPDYGTLAQFRTFLREAHRRGLRVITELVLNHTSNQHPWFQRARNAPPHSRFRDWYVWTNDPQRYSEARIIFQDFETSNWSWDEEAGAYYWHRFYSQQPDLNFENIQVQRELMRVVDFWFDMGVDGLRLDAVPYLFEAEGTNCENLPATHDYLRRLREHIEERFPDRVLLAEANQWPEDAVQYFGDGDECHMCFHFPVMPRLFMGLQLEDRYPIVDILQQTPPLPPGCQWALFLRNHDELTLEMVTDEERDYMYRVYARDRATRINLGIRRRLAPLLDHDRKRIELMHALLLSLPGTPILYYGDEIGMGDNVYLGDRDGVRTPMQWSADRNAGFSAANPQRVYLPPVIDPACHFEAVNVETQLQNPSSLLWWMRRLLALRHQHRVFGRGSVEILQPDNPHVLAFLRRFDDDQVIVVANLSRHAQFVTLDLPEFVGARPMELFGQSTFPLVTDAPYTLTLGPHGFYWLAVSPQPQRAGEERPVVRLGRRAWSDLLDRDDRYALTTALRAFLPRQRWYLGKDRTLRGLDLIDAVPMRVPDTEWAALTTVDAHYATGEPERYVLPLAVLTGDHAANLARQRTEAVVADVERRTGSGLLVDATALPQTMAVLYRLLTGRRRLRTSRGHELAPVTTPAFRRVAGHPALGDDSEPLEVVLGHAEQSNTSAVIAGQWVLKLYRRAHVGRNPDHEIGAHLAALRSDVAPLLAGALELGVDGDVSTLAVVHRLVPNEGDMWARALGDLGLRLERILSEQDEQPVPLTDTRALVEAARSPEPEQSDDVIRAATVIGQRLGELHRVLADSRGDPAFAPEPFGALYRRSLRQSFRNRAQRTLAQLKSVLHELDPTTEKLAREVLGHRDVLLSIAADAMKRELRSQRTRIHGDLHLGQVLWTGRDAVFIDFEGEPIESIGERRIKRSPAKDLAGMLRSFDYATHVARAESAARGINLEEHEARIDAATRRWYAAMSTELLRGWFRATDGASFVGDDDETASLLEAYMLDKALYEVSYELRSRPDWVHVPLRGVLQIASSRVGEGS